MSQAQPNKKSMSLAEVLEAAAYAERRVDSWPEWKRELSFWSVSSPQTAAAASSSKPSGRDEWR